MKRFFVITAITFFLILVLNYGGWAQCSICAKSVQQMGAKPAQGFNSGILYLMLIPYGAIGVIGYRWWRSNR